MKFEKIHYDDEKATFVLKGTSVAYANALRRIITNKVPTMAIDDVTFVENGSALYDEILANRIGLIPLKTDLESYNEKAKCKCKGVGCARCTLKITLNKTGPCIVHAEDMKSKDPAVKAVHPKMPIVKLLDGQNLKFEANAVISCGKEHVKFSPGLAFYHGYPIIKLKSPKDPKKAVEICPKKVYKMDGQKLKVADELKCDLCKACSDASEGIEVEGSKTEFIFNIESWGQLSVKDIVIQALRVFDEELDELEEEVKDLK